MKGFSLVEILLVITILVVLVGFSLPVAFGFYKSQQLGSQTQGILQTLRRAQLKAMSVENDSAFGVYLTNDNYTLFKGSFYINRDVSYDEIFDLPAGFTVSGLQEIVFSKFEGLPSVIGTIVLSNNGDSQSVIINEIGRINIQ